jgi:cellulose synthase/poly-beta-1,6-N-acetylglucosamine synthase-like glycosyltransferase
MPINIVLVDKENGGKADSINAALNYASKKYICTIDADSILDVRALKMVVAPMIEDSRVFVSGGFLATSNDMILRREEGGACTNAVEYVGFMANCGIYKIVYDFATCVSRLNMLLVMSGAFSLFKKEDLLKVGGFLSEFNEHPCVVNMVGRKRKTVCEDMEIIVRLWRFHLEQHLPGKAVFLPNPVCWTEVPDKARNLYKQRVRWHQGLGEL